MPFRPILLRLREAIDSRNSSSECLSPVSMPETLTCSHSMGTLSALKISLTDSETSAPMPSPGMSVTVYLPPNLVGLKMSDCTVAIDRAGSECNWVQRAKGRTVRENMANWEGLRVLFPLKSEGRSREEC